MKKPIVRLLTCGSVDDGKSTLIGRLLFETGSVPDDTIASARTIRRSGSTIAAGEIDFSLLTDGLEAEREQGITIDVAYRSMNLRNGRRLIIADAPGHEQYTRNMAVAASRSDIALVLVDATRGVRAQTLRHLTICSLMGVTKIAIVVNKLDAVQKKADTFIEIKKALVETIRRLDLKNVEFIPISALNGDNLVSPSANLSWFKGPTLLQYVEDWDLETELQSNPRLGVQLISRAENFRGVAGTVIGGRFTLGDEVTVLPSGQKGRISRLTTFDGELTMACDSQAITMVLEPDLDVTRGDAIELSKSANDSADRFTANLVWLADEYLIPSKSYYLISGSKQVPALVTKIRHTLNVVSGQEEAAKVIKVNEIGTIDIATDSPISLTSYKSNRYTGNFILVDRSSMKTVGAGMVLHTLRRSLNVSEHRYEVDRLARAVQKGQKPKVLWFTGLSGSGKSTLANELEKQLVNMGMHSYVLDGDNLRLGLNKDLGFTREDRAENVRRVSEVAKMFFDAGLITIVALVSPFSSDRDQAKNLFPQGDFIEVWVKTPPEICKQRDPKGLYKKAASGQLPNLTGVGQEYEPPLNAEVVLDGTQSIETNLLVLIEAILSSRN